MQQGGFKTVFVARSLSLVSLPRVRKKHNTLGKRSLSLYLACLFAAQVAYSVGVKQFVVPGSTVEDSRGALELAQQKPNVRAAGG